MARSFEQMAAELDNAALNARAIPQLTEDDPALTLADAREIQRLSIERRLGRGEKIVGLKVGFTSRAKMLQMGVDDLILGRLTDAMRLEEGGSLAFENYVHPRIEPEIAFLIGKRLSGIVTPLEALAAIAGVAPAMEVIDSRYANFKFSVADVVADNSSSSGFVVGPWNPPSVDISNLGMILSFNGAPREIGSSAAILGHPARALVVAARLAEQNGLALEPGHIVMAGAATAAVALAVGDYVELETRIGRVALKVAGDCAELAA
jgi:2-oxo-3-hexenedioate decarboxylase